MKDNIIEAITSFKNYLENKYELKAPVESYDINDIGNSCQVRINNKLIGITNYDAKKNLFIGFKEAKWSGLKPRQTWTIGDHIKANGIYKRV